MVPPAAPSPTYPAVPTDAVRWLHDKYERLGAEEGQLAANRTSYFAAIGTVLITGFVIGLNYFLPHPELLAEVVTFLAGLGILISVVWLILLHRTIDAQQLWRQSATALERLAPPVSVSLPATIAVRPGALLGVDLARPYSSHALWFSKDGPGSWVDHVSPDILSQVLPLTLVIVWSGVLAAVWVYALG